MPSSSHATNPDRETRQQILDAARDLFLARGYKGVSMKDIAEAVGLTSAALYYHFPHGKEEVALEMLRTMVLHISEEVRATISLGGSFPEQLARVVQVFLRQPLDRAQLLMRDLHTQLPDISQATFRGPMEDVEAQVTQLFQQASAQGLIRDDISPALVSQFFGGMMLALMRPAFADDEPTTPRPVVAAALIETLLHGIAPTT